MLSASGSMLLPEKLQQGEGRHGTHSMASFEGAANVNIMAGKYNGKTGGRDGHQVCSLLCTEYFAFVLGTTNK